MGLRKDGSNPLLTPEIQAWLPAIVMIAAAVLLAAGGESAALAFRFDREAIIGGGLHRLLTAHFVHLGLRHLLLNAAGLALVWVLTGSAYRPLRWLAITLAVVATIDAGFLLLMPDLAWYVGLSGVLHGLLVAGLIGRWSERRPELRILFVLLLGKLAWEILFGALPGSSAASGGNVIVEAHLFGSIGGLVGALVTGIRVGRPASL